MLGTRGIPNVMGGVETHCQAIYPRLAKKGHEITIFARRGYTNYEHSYNYQGVSVIPIWAPKKKSFEALVHTAFGLLYIAKNRKRFDLIHFHAIGPSLMIPFARLLGHKVVMTHHGPEYERLKWGKLAKAVLRLGEFIGCLNSHSIITVSPHIRGLVEKKYNRQGQYIPNGVLLPEILAPGEFLTKWGLMAGKYLLAVGRLVPEKGFHVLLEAFAQLDADWHLVIAGAADHEDEYSTGLKRQASLDKRVIMTGFIKGKELAEIFSNTGLFVLPSYHEGLPIAVLEAMSFRLPILTSDIPANRELADPTEMFPVGDVNALRNKLEEFFASPWSFAKNQGKIESEYNWDRVVEQTEVIYRNVLVKGEL